MTIIEQLVEDYKRDNPSASPEEVKAYIQSLEQHTKVIKEDEWAFNAEQDSEDVLEGEIKERDDDSRIITSAPE